MYYVRRVTVLSKTKLCTNVEFVNDENFQFCIAITIRGEVKWK